MYPFLRAHRLSVKLTPAQEQQIAEFLVGLDNDYLSIDLTQQALFNRAQQQDALFGLSQEALSKTFPQYRQDAYSILCHFRDSNILTLEEAGSHGWRWVRVPDKTREGAA
jgi:hypothetical protein